MEVSGKIKWIDEVKTYGGNGFRKREVVVTTEEQYPQQPLKDASMARQLELVLLLFFLNDMPNQGTS